MNFHIITIFPEMFDAYFKESIIGRAQKNKIIKIKIHNLRKWTNDKHKTVDDTPCGGGPGMVMKVEPIYKAIKFIKKKLSTKKDKSKTKIILLSAKGNKYTQQKAKKYTELDNIIFICGRYEGVDERVLEFVDEEISIGDYVLTGGELPAMTILDSITRLLPGSLGNKESIKQESHCQKGVLEYPQYTKPKIFQAGQKKLSVPDVLLSGNHAEIEKWRRKNEINNR